MPSVAEGREVHDVDWRSELQRVLLGSLSQSNPTQAILPGRHCKRGACRCSWCDAEQPFLPHPRWSRDRAYRQVHLLKLNVTESGRQVAAEESADKSAHSKITLQQLATYPRLREHAQQPHSSRPISPSLCRAVRHSLFRYAECGR